MNNPFYVQPANFSGIMEGMQGFKNNADQKAVMDEAAAAEMKAKQENDAIMREGALLIQSKDHDAIADWAFRNPKHRAQFIEAADIQDKFAKKSRLETARDVLTGRVSPVDAYKERYDEIIAGGGAAPELGKDLDLGDEEELKNMALEDLAMLDPVGYKNYLSTKGTQADTEQMQTAGIADFEYYKDLKKTDPEAAKQFGVERGFVSKEGRELSGHMQKRLSIASDEAIESESNAGNFESLADQIQDSDMVGGKKGVWKERFKEVSGSQDAVSSLRRKYNAIRASQLVNNLPPGAASEKDVELALSGFPADTASKEQLASFLRGVAKLETLKAEFANFKAEYISSNGTERGMLKAWKESAAKPNTETPKYEGANLEAYNWAQSNPNDPRAAAILKKLGAN